MKKNIKFLYELKKDVLKKALEKLLSNDKNDYCYYYYENRCNHLVSDMLNKKLYNHENLSMKLENQILNYLKNFDRNTIDFYINENDEYFIIVSYRVQKFIKDTECY